MELQEIQIRSKSRRFIKKECKDFKDFLNEKIKKVFTI